MIPAFTFDNYDAIRLVVYYDKKQINHKNLLAINNKKSRKRDLMKNIRRR